MVLEEVSVSRAAERLGISQSAVSHTLDKLRGIFDDPLFIRSGRGIEATPRARALAVPIESVLDDLKSLTDHREFDPRKEDMEFTIAPNDFPVQLIFPKLLKGVSEEGVNLRIRFIPAGIPNVSMLSASRYRMLITPNPPDNPELEKVSLIQSKMEVFYDSAVRKPPKTREEYAKSRYLEVRFSDTESSIMALPILDKSRTHLPAVMVPNFSLVSSMIKGTDLITTQIGAMKLGLLRDLDLAPLPFQSQTLNLYLVWHRRG